MSDTPKVTPGTPGAARVEYYACREDVEALIGKGYSVRMAYKDMKEQGRVTCSYSAFADYVRGGGKRLHSKKGKRPKPGLQMPQRTGPIIVGKPKNSFGDPADVDITDCI